MAPRRVVRSYYVVAGSEVPRHRDGGARVARARRWGGRRRQDDEQGGFRAAWIAEDGTGRGGIIGYLSDVYDARERAVGPPCC